MFIGVAILFGPMAAALGSWESRAPTPESGGYGQALVGTGSHLYLLKGYSATSTQKFWRYDPVSDVWATMSTTGLPDGTMRNGATLDWDSADKLYALAGARYTDSGRTEFWSFSFGSNAWTRKADTPCPQGAGDAMTWSPNAGVLFAIIGSSGHGRCFAKYDPGSNSWTPLANTPAGTDDGASLEWAGAASGRYLYALRGEFFETGPPVQDFWRYDTQTDAWTSLAAIPETDGVGDGGSLLWAGNFDAGLADYVFALGGNAPDETPGYDAYRYSITSGTWTSLAGLPFPVGNFNGNRLGYAGGNVYYVQMGLSGYPGGGDELGRLSGVGEGGAPPTGDDQVRINEVEHNPKRTDTGKEYVELYNFGTTTVDLTNWIVTANAGTPSSVTLSGSLAPGAYRVVTRPGGFLDDTDEWVTLQAPDLALVDQSPAQSDTKDNNQSWQVVGGSWVFKTSTKGGPN